MKMIVGLGNPGKEYEKTRHNVGWQFIDTLINHKDIHQGDGSKISLKQDKKFVAMIGKGRIESEDVMIVKPMTFMNLSGKSIKGLADYYSIEYKDIWVFCDDLDLPLGMVRIRDTGRSGGHNGLQSIFDYLKTDNIVRVRMGIAPIKEEGNLDELKREMPDAEIYVLQTFNKREAPIIEKVIEETANNIVEAIRENRLDNHTFSIL